MVENSKMRRLTQNDLRRLIREEINLNEGIFSWLGQKVRDFFSRKERALFQDLINIFGKNGNVEEFLILLRTSADVRYWFLNILHSEEPSYLISDIFKYTGGLKYLRWKIPGFIPDLHNARYNAQVAHLKAYANNYMQNFNTLSANEKKHWIQTLTDLIEEQNQRPTTRLSHEEQEQATKDRSGLARSNLILYIKQINLKQILKMNNAQALTFMKALLWDFVKNYYISRDEYNRRKDTIDQPKAPITTGVTSAFNNIIRQSNADSRDRAVRNFITVLENVQIPGLQQSDIKHIFNHIEFKPDEQSIKNLNKINIVLISLLERMNSDYRTVNISHQQFNLIIGNIHIILSSQPDPS
jgi:hypothetical protein